MAKKELKMPAAGTAPAPSPLHNMVHHSVSAQAPARVEENKRTTIVINPDTYRMFKAYAAESGQTVTSLINGFMEETLKRAGK